jgi:replicative DNA helicase
MRGEGKNREEEVSGISRGLKRIAKEFGIPIIALAQLNRKVEERHEKRPMLSDLRESGSIEQDADVVWLLWRPAYYDIPTVVDEERNEVSSDGLMVIDIAKNRNGACGDFNLWHNQPLTVIQDTKPELQNLPY